MYKIYINGTPLFLGPKTELVAQASGKTDVLLARYPGRSKFLLQYVDMLEKTDRFNAVYLYADDVKDLFQQFKQLFKIIKAAGGVVSNPADEVLAIYRRGSWDLPKGKIDKGEGKRAAAVREVIEETGLTQVKIGKRLTVTYHTYRDHKSRRILKKTYWYRMTSEAENLTPQTEEDIEKAVWIKIPDLLATDQAIYGNIQDVLNIYLK